MSALALAHRSIVHTLRACSRRHLISAASSAIASSILGCFVLVLIIDEVGRLALLARRLVVCSCGGLLVILVEVSEMNGLSVGTDCCQPLVDTIWFVSHV